jgi:hypothetical protein
MTTTTMSDDADPCTWKCADVLELSCMWFHSCRCSVQVFLSSCAAGRTQRNITVPYLSLCTVEAVASSLKIK